MRTSIALRSAQCLPILLHLANNVSAAEGTLIECRDRKSAILHFERGVDLYEKKRLDAALAEFRHSRDNCTTENNTLNLALVLRDLGRPIDAVVIVDELERDFPILSPENAATAKQLRMDLEKIIGTAVVDGDYPGAAILIDNTRVGALPMARPIRLPIGMHDVRVELFGYYPLVTSFFVKPQNTTMVAVTLKPVEQPEQKPPPPLPKNSLRFDAALGLSPTFGGDVDRPPSNGGPGLGAAIWGGYRGRLNSSWRLGALAGYGFFWQHREGRITFSRNAPSVFADVNDELLLHALFAAPQISTVFYLGNHRFDASFGLGVVGGPLVNLRQPQDPGAFRVINPATPSAGFVGVMTHLQGSWRSPWSFLGKWPTQITLGVMGIGRASTPTYTDSLLSGNSTLPGEFSDGLLGSWILVFTPGIAVEYDL